MRVEDMNATVRSVTEAYENIDNKIIYLLRSSSEDFLHLNAFFKEYYKEAKIISENASRIFEGVGQPRMKRFADELQVYCSYIDNLLNFQRDSFQQQSKTLSQIERKQQNIFSPFNNLRQNLSSVRLLLAGSGTNQKQDDFNLLRKNINDIQLLLEQIDRLFLQLQNTRIQLIEEMDKASKIAEQTGLLLDNTLRNTSERYSEFLTWATGNIDNIYNYSKNVNVSYGEIITNLQYQDIIRQKIEHIQQSHVELINELTQLQESEGFQLALCKIRDISGIQSAQLLHANKQYQMAVEVILNKFFELSESIDSITEISQSVGKTSKRNSRSPLDEVITNTENSAKQFDLLTLSKHRREELLSQAINITERLTSDINRVNELFTTIEPDLSAFIEKTENTKTPQAEVIKSISLFSDTKNFAANATNILDQIHVLTKELHVEVPESFIENGQKIAISDFYQKLPDILTTLKADKTEILSLLVDLEQRYKSKKGEIQNAVKDIKYYSYFEKTIEEIIVEMNQVNLLFDDDVKDREFSAREHLDELKRKYTMSSEHLIHDHITQQIENGGGDVDAELFEDFENTNDNEDDNLELF
jgi:hypothetical protein